MLNMKNTDLQLTINGASGCQLRLLAVGEGGHGNTCGGGSGFIQYRTLEISQAYSPYTVYIYKNRTSSSVDIYGKNGFSPVIITALPGQDATETRGGEGYSGGKKYVHIFKRPWNLPQF